MEMEGNNVEKDKDTNDFPAVEIVNNIYSLRSNFIIIGLTGRTGSGCTTVADIMSKYSFDDLKSNYQLFRCNPIDNQARKDRIVYNYLRENWAKFKKITASDIIYYFAFQLTFDEFKDQLKMTMKAEKMRGADEVSLSALDSLRSKYDNVHKDVVRIEGMRNAHKPGDGTMLPVILEDIPSLRADIEEILDTIQAGCVSAILQQWGDNIRKNKTVQSDKLYQKDAPEAIASLINYIIKVIRRDNGRDKPTRIVIDALRNPFEILYFRERYASFYCMSVNTEQSIRHDKLIKTKNLTFADIEDIDQREMCKKELGMSFSMIDIDKCIELSDIHLSHDGTMIEDNFDLINQLFTYIALILHPGLVPPTPLERLMQIAFTTKLNSGCLSRQVGAVVTDSHFSLKAIGWNSVPEGQVPCSLRVLDDLINREDQDAFSYYERNNENFRSKISKLNKAYKGVRDKLNGIHLTYCFKNIYTNLVSGQQNNQVHTRSLHAEENAFLQIAKYGGGGLNNGKLFTTASCCELCAKKAYQIGISEIYYIDTYPGITGEHILASGNPTLRPKTILFRGAIGRAYMNLYNPILPLKDEIASLTGLDIAGLDIKDMKESLQAEK